MRLSELACIASGHAGRGCGICHRQPRQADNETCNTNPPSFKAALDGLLDSSGEPWGAFGGREGAREYATGPNADKAVQVFGSGARFFPRQEDLIEQSQNELRADEALLAKGSRSHRMERVVEALRARN